MWSEIYIGRFTSVSSFVFKNTTHHVPFSVGIRSYRGCWYDCRIYDKVDVLVMGFRDMNRLMYGNDENQWDKG